MPAADVPRLDLYQIHRRVSDVAASRKTPEETLLDFLKLALGLVNAGAAVFYSRNAAGLNERKSILSRQALAWSADLRAEISQSARRSLDRNRLQVDRLSQLAQAVVIAVPVSMGTTETHCLALVALIGDQPLEPFLVSVQLMGACIGLWLESLPNALAGGLVPLQRAVIAAAAQVMAQTDKKRAVLRLVNDLKSILGCDRVMLARAARQGRLAMSAVSDVTAAARRSTTADMLQKVLDECSAQKKVLSWPEPFGEAAVTSLILKTLAVEMHARRALCLPLEDPGEELVGALVLLWGEHAPNAAILAPLLQHSGPLLAACLNVLYPVSSGKRRRKTSGALPWPRFRRAAGAALVAGLIAGMAFLPVRHKIKGPCEVRPVILRMVPAPFDGILETVRAAPGRVVKAGDLLARMEGKRIELEISGLLADANKALKMHDIHMASGDTAQAQIALLEKQRLDQKIKLLKRQLVMLSIVSPIDGIVLSGDLRRVAGSPVQRGQPLFEVAPLGDMRVEIFISQADVTYVHPAMPVEVKFGAYPHERWKGRLQRVLPKSEIRDRQNVFIAQLRLTNTDGRLRPGMRGTAWVAGKRRPLAWIVFHKPWNNMAAALGF